MRLYLDSLDNDDLRRLLATGLFYGVTTNPLLSARAGRTYSQIDWTELFHLADDTGLSECHIQLPDTSKNAVHFVDDIMESASTFKVQPVIKVPLTIEGIALVSSLKEAGVPILMTACYHAKQMFVAQALEATYIAPYFGRMIEAGLDARTHLRRMKAISSGSASGCRILVASLRSIDQMCELAEDGHECMTIAPALADELMSDELTDKAASVFQAAAHSST